MLGWDVGTFEFVSSRILATGYNKAAKLRMRTGGSTAKVPRKSAQKLTEGDGYFWEIGAEEGKNALKLPVKYRYRSPIVFEFHVSGKRKADAYAVVWLHHLVDNEDVPINIPIWQASNPARLTQNYVTEENCTKEKGLEDLKEVGRLQFRGKFSPGMDESHEAFISDNDSRETFETWEACLSEGVRQRTVEKEVTDRVQTLHDESLTSGRDVLKTADEDEKQKWLSKTGTDWSGAFGEDPKAYMDSSGRKRREPGRDRPLHDPFHPSSDEGGDFEEGMDTSDDTSDLGIQDADNMDRNKSGMNEDPSRPSVDTTRTADTADTNGTSPGAKRRRSFSSRFSGFSRSSNDPDRQTKRTEERRQRGLMQWRPARNAKFAKDQGTIGIRKLKNRVTGGLEGRQPGVETGESILFSSGLYEKGEHFDVDVMLTICFNRDGVVSGLRTVLALSHLGGG